MARRHYNLFNNREITDTTDIIMNMNTQTFAGNRTFNFCEVQAVSLDGGITTSCKLMIEWGDAANTVEIIEVPSNTSIVINTPAYTQYKTFQIKIKQISNHTKVKLNLFAVDAQYFEGQNLLCTSVDKLYCNATTFRFAWFTVLTEIKNIYLYGGRFWFTFQSCLKLAKIDTNIFKNLQVPITNMRSTFYKTPLNQMFIQDLIGGVDLSGCDDFKQLFYSSNLAGTGMTFVNAPKASGAVIDSSLYNNRNLSDYASIPLAYVQSV